MTIKFNKIINKGDYYELVLTDKNKLEVGRAKIDKEDLKKVKSIGRWCLSKDGYVKNGAINTVLMHRVIMNAEKDDLVDHVKTGIKYRTDNRKENLRICNQIQNQNNVQIRKNNTSGYRGVSWCKRTKKWQASIRKGGTRKNLGYFSEAKDASLAYELAAKESHGVFYNMKELR